MSKKKLFLLDGHALVYRAHFAFIGRPLINSKGFNTSAITGFTRTLWDLMRNENPTHVGVVFDPSGPTFRNEVYPEYKANREEQPDDIRASFPFIFQILEGMNIPVCVVDNFEADDVIGTLAKKAELEGFTTYMVTPDKDYGQLVSENIYMYKPSRQGGGVEIFGVPEICEKWGIKRVDQVIDMLGLQGDSVDNIPGIPGIGPKTAQKLLAQYDDIEGLIANADQLKGKQKERVIEFADQARLSRQLATIKLDVPIDFNANDFTIDPVDKEKLAPVFKELEFRSLASQILGEVPPPAAGQQGDLFAAPNDQPARSQEPAKHSVATNNIHSTEHDYQLVDTAEGRAKLLADLLSQKEVCFDTETTGIDPTIAELVGLSFSWKSGTGYYVPVSEKFEDAKAVVHEFADFFQSPTIVKIAQNIKYDVQMLLWYEMPVEGFYFDTMVAHYLLEPGLRHNMNYLSETYLKYQPISIESLIGKKGVKQRTMRSAPVEQVAEYAAEDADITFQLKEYLEPWLKKENLTDLYTNIEEPLIKVLAAMEHEGINLDCDYLAEYALELRDQIEALEKEIITEAGTDFNIGSPSQVGETLFDKMGLPYRYRKTKTGKYSTDEEKLSELAEEFPIAGQILRHRSLSKLLSTYVIALPKLIHPKTGRIHTSFNQAMAATGRLSSNNPNLQNIPVRTPEGRKIREAFVPRDADHILLAADYSQVELRLIAEMSGDEAMMEAFIAGQDIHAATAARVFEVPFDEVTKEQRYRAKTVNFSIIYGAGATNLSKQLEISRNEASDLIAAYFKQYSGLKKYMDDTVAFAQKHGYVETMLGRKRGLRDINSKSSLARSNAERMAINTPIQGTAADLIKIAMVNLYQEMKKRNLKSKMLLQVHDELVFDAHKSEIEELTPLITHYMQSAIPNLRVPIIVEVGEGTNWLEAH